MTAQFPSPPKITVPAMLLAAVLCLVSGAAGAHPIEYHMRPLEPEIIERVIDSLERVAGEVGNSDAAGAFKLPGDAMGAAAMLWSLQDALMAADGVTTTDSPSLKRALLAAGYRDSYYVVEQWQAEAERVIESWEVIRRGLDMGRIYSGYAELEGERAGLSEEQAIERESALIRDHELLRTTAMDLERVLPYLPRLDALAGQLGFRVRP